MQVKTVKVSEKGQIAIPLDVREAIGLKKGDELLLLQEGGKILLGKATTALKDEFMPLLKASEKTAKELWDNEFDEVWDNV
ncbi:AbrB/MazE/SpoVT family DNA-binding domain-containing protein [Candidatus Woesearchaeota archaeon]|nr:AbrB/MazE/SpoVT family DNA-binding domain-containing protein [Candidatus Woesearchaeota archaeon]